MFWKLTLFTSHVDTLLDKEDVTLQEVLDEDDVLQECKAQNQKLIDFLIRPEHVEELVNLTTQEPSEEMDEKVKYKYPNIACELLTSDVSQINDKLAEDDNILNKIYSFMETDAKMNPLLASFFSKVMGLLITRKSEKMVEFLKSKEDFVGQLLHHLGTSAIMDLLLRLITCIESTECRNEAISWLNEHELVQKLIAMIDPAHSEEKQCNASQTLCDIIRLSREQMSQLQEKADPDPLLQLIESEKTVSDLLGHMLDGQKVESVMVSGLSVIQTLLEFKKTGPEGLSEQMTDLDEERLNEGVHNTLKALEARSSDLHNILVEPPKQFFSVMPTTAGSLDPPLGNTRLQIVRLISTMLQSNSFSINTEICRLGTITVLLDLYFKYIWNNFLHTQVENILLQLLRNPPQEGNEEQDLPLLNQLLTESRLIQRILDGWEENENAITRPGGKRKGYMGHLTKIANYIMENSEKGATSEKIKGLVKDIPEEYKERWDTFLSETLVEVNKKNTIELVGGHHLHSSSDDEDADFRDIPIPQDTAMQQLQQMTSTFIDQFGFGEEEFSEQEERVDGPFTDRISSINFDVSSAEDSPNAATLFEQACNQRMQQFDDHATEDPIWDDKEVTFSQVTDTRQSSLQNSGQNQTQDSIDSDGSSDSDEDLESPQRIYQTPGSSANSEKMDIDNAADWRGNVDNDTESTPVAMDTQSPWDSSNPAPPVTANGTNDDNWAKFDNVSVAKPNENVEGWANFDQFTSLKTAPDLSETDPGPRSSSPVAMDTGDATPTSNKAATYSKYLVSSAPADLATQVESSVTNEDSAKTPSDSDSPDAKPVKDDSANEETSAASENTSCAIKPQSSSPTQQHTDPPEKPPPVSPPLTPRGTPPSNKDLLSVAEEEIHNSIKSPEKSNTESESSPRRTEVAESSPAGASGVELCINDDDYDDDDDDLMDNFSFLASAGLMKVDSGEKSTEDPSIAHNNTEESNSRAQADSIEEMREKAKEALEMYHAATSPGTTVQNGPV